MALTKVSGGILDPGINVAGIVTATGFDGPFIGGGDGVNAGIGTFTGLDVNGNGDISGNLVIGGNLTANGDFTTLNTTLREVEILRVDADTTAVAGIITQRGSGDIFSAYDTSTEVFKIADGGKIGINTTDASHLLTVFAQSASSNIARFKAFNGNSNFDIHTDASSHGQARVRNNIGAVKVELNSNGDSYFTGGDVGIGTDNPTDVLDVYSDTDPTIRSRSGSSTVGANVEICGGSSNDSQLMLSSGTTLKYQFFRDGSQSDDLRIYDSTNSLDIIRYRHGGYLHFGVNGEERLRITSDGKVGIGITNPTEKLEVNSGSIAIVGMPSGGGYKIDTHPLVSYASFVLDGGNYACRLGSTGTSTVRHTQIYGGGSHIATFDGVNTRLGIGKTNPDEVLHIASSSSPKFRLTDTRTSLSDNTQYGVIQFEQRDSNTPGVSVEMGAVLTDTTNGATALQFKTGTPSTIDERLRITSGGSVGIGTDNPTKKLEINTTGTSGEGILLKANDSTYTAYRGDANRTAYDLFIVALQGYWNGNRVGDVTIETGSDTTNKDEGMVKIRTRGDGDSGPQDRLTVYHTGQVQVHSTTDSSSTTSGALRVDGGVGVAKNIICGGEITTAQDYPNFRPTLDFNFAAEKKLDPRITYSRTGPASFVNELSKVVLVGDNSPRFDHDPITRECKGLLMEESRTNQITGSFDLTVSGYSPVNVDITPSTTETLAPSGDFTASKMVVTTTAQQHYINFNNMTKANGAERQCVSFWAKLTSSNYPILKSYITGAGAFTNYSEARFNLSTGVVTAYGYGGYTNHSAKMTQYPNGWYKCEYEATLDSSETTKRFQLLANNGSSDAGNGTDGYYIWGVQVEVGAFATSLIPTNGSTVTRGEDVALIDGTEFTDFFNAIEGTSVVHAHMPNATGFAGMGAYAFKNSSNSNVHLGLSRDSGSDPVYHYYHDGSNNGYTRASATADNMYKGALSFKTNDLDSYVNGSLNTNTTTFTMPTIDNLRIGGVGTPNQLGGHVARFMYYPVKLTNNQLATLTS